MITGLDIFCGAGGSSAGARAAGVTMRGAVDMDAVATASYRDNYPDAHVVTARLEEIDVSALHARVGDVDLLLASPECTNHTCAKGSAPRSEESRATAMSAVEYAKAFSPRWLVMENVVHMRPWSRYAELKRELEALGYKLGEQVIDASTIGVPQSRRRLFIVGDRERAPRLVPAGTVTPVPASAILDPAGTWKTTLLDRPGRAAGTLARAERAFQALGRETPFLLVYYGTDGSGGWQPLDRPLRTITTVDRFALVTPSPDGPRMRMLQVPELRRAMGLPPGYLLNHGTRRDRVRLLGNGVCPPVMEAVVRALTGSGETNDAGSADVGGSVPDELHEELFA
ncbi:DNA cytosine methyltransferase [Sphingomonas endophytica]|uniref:DNA cytosine methyltransferase n=1 Tax=Sphingomonas endophytica TaxID=869719 RepID=UPI0019D33F37|nr:DNA cytosine methyltransferase [Sphingomonas endophytica]